MSKDLKEELNKLMGHPSMNFERKLWNGEFNNPISKQYKISICTTCMGRLSDLSVSLTRNLEDNKDYPNVEFVVLDYNSKDGLGKWVKENLASEIESGRVVYVRTEEPQFYSMTHSRNIAFKCATGDIVNNVDADNFTNKGFANYLNRLANQVSNNAIFAKGRKMLRGRLGFWKDDFIKLGGYDESIEDYGHDDWDLMLRAWASGFTLMYFGGQYYDNTGSKKHQTGNMKEKNWKLTETRNKVLSARAIVEGRLVANSGREWGKTKIIKNFKEEINL